MFNSKNGLRNLIGVSALILLTVAASVNAQLSSVDPTFSAAVSKDITAANAQPNFIVQPDAKIIVFGNFQAIGGAVKTGIARLNADGSVDNSFNCSTCNFVVGSAILQPDGKIIIGSTVSTGSGTNSAIVRRLNTDGSADASFVSPFPASVAGQAVATVQDIQSDGKILVIYFTQINGGNSYSLYRLNTDGSFDSSFPAVGVGGGQSVRTIPARVKVAPDGRIYVLINTSSLGPSSAAVRRYSANGTLDSNFNPSFTGNLLSLNDIAILSDNSFTIGGSFTTVNGVSRVNVVKFAPEGNVDLAFAPTVTFSLSEVVSQVKATSGDKTLISTSSHIYRLNSDGSLDATFNQPANLTAIYHFELDAANRVYISGVFTEGSASVTKFARLNADGSVEYSFAVNIGSVGSVATLAAQADNKVVIAGDFTRVGNAARKNIARLNADGSPDTSFDPGTGFDLTPLKIIIQPDGKILAVGYFTSYNGAAQSFLVRLNVNGSRDTSFAPTLNAPAFDVALQTDGKIVIGGNFSTVNGATHNGVARLNADGSLDTNFNPTFGSFMIRALFIQSDGKIMVGGIFSGVNGFSRTNLARLNADGTLDTTFNAGGISTVKQIQQLSSGKYIVLTNMLLQLTNDGATERTLLSAAAGSIYTFLVQPDNSIIVGGAITVGGRNYLVRLKPDGGIDNGFLPGGANAAVNVLVAQADGKVLVGGDFSQINNVTRLAVARINAAPYRNITPFDFDGDGKADLAVFRPSSGYWYILKSADNSFAAVQFGQSGDQIAPADYDGDGKTDIAVFRDTVSGAGNLAYFYILDSSTGAFRYAQFGLTGDVPVVGDWDADGKADLAVYRNGATAGAQSYFYYRPTATPTTNYREISWGSSGDKPQVGDYDGDGKNDAAVFRPSTATWYIFKSNNSGSIQQQFGTTNDIPAPADYDGDGITNIAVFRPSNGTFYTSTNAATNYGAVQFGTNGDLPVPADYDGDGKFDVAVYRPSNGSWYLLRSTQGFTGVGFGLSGDKPIPNAYVR